MKVTTSFFGYPKIDIVSTLKKCYYYDMINFQEAKWNRNANIKNTPRGLGLNQPWFSSPLGMWRLPSRSAWVTSAEGCEQRLSAHRRGLSHVLWNNHRHRSRRAGALSVGCVGYGNAGVEVMEIITGITAFAGAALVAWGVVPRKVKKEQAEMKEMRKVGVAYGFPLFGECDGPKTKDRQLDWSDAPEFANYAVKDSRGVVIFTMEKPVLVDYAGLDWVWDAVGIFDFSGFTIDGEWRQSLRERPAKINLKNLHGKAGV